MPDNVVPHVLDELTVQLAQLCENSTEYDMDLIGEVSTVPIYNSRNELIRIFYVLDYNESPATLVVDVVDDLNGSVFFMYGNLIKVLTKGIEKLIPPKYEELKEIILDDIANNR